MLYPYWPLWTTVFMFLTFTCHFWSSPPPFTTDAGRWADPKSHSFEGQDDQHPPRNFHIQSQYGNMLGMIGEYWFDDFMSHVTWGKIQYFHIGKDFRCKMIRISNKHYGTHSRFEGFLTCAVVGKSSCLPIQIAYLWLLLQRWLCP